MNHSNSLKTQLTNMIDKSIRSIKSAERSIAEGDYDFAASRSYYAAFYAIEAIILTQNLTFSRHGNVIGSFNKNFIKNGTFPKEFSKIISRLFRERQIADYEFNIAIDKVEAEENLGFSKDIVKAIISYLVNQNFINPVNI